jgi:EAL domain-containing protein (putative c-di-GMP-specific phosphodiesterase class I)
VLNIALRDLNAICDVTDDVSVSINASPRNLRDEDFDAVIADAMAVWGIDATRLIIEVTESALMNDPEVSLKTLRRLCDMGLRVAIDDFGTGYSNMTYLRDLPAWELKIDQSFIRGICRDEKDRKIVSSIIQLAHALELKVVAEGIETQDVADVVTELGCDLGQGYLYGRPVVIEDFIGTLNAQNPELSR